MNASTTKYGSASISACNAGKAFRTQKTLGTMKTLTTESGTPVHAVRRTPEVMAGYAILEIKGTPRRDRARQRHCVFVVHCLWLAKSSISTRGPKRVRSSLAIDQKEACNLPLGEPK
jgi:hypothetical protein